jgi:hypothetical protein
VNTPSSFLEIGIDDTDLLKALHERCGEVRCFTEAISDAASSSVVDLIDSFCSKHGFTAIGEQWCELTEEAASRHLSAVLQRDLAYGSEMISAKQARAIAVKFIECCKPAHYFSNTPVSTKSIETTQENSQTFSDRPLTNGWQPLTQATFDSGVVAVGKTKIALLWIEDED